MSVIATDTKRISNLLKRELWAEVGYCREVVTVNEATAKTYAVGTVLGKVTTNGKYKIAVETAVDGSKVGAGIVLEDKAIAATTDTKLVVLVKGPAAVAKGALVIDATYDNGTKLGVLYADFAAKDIMVLESA
jgi:hypothetical protein